MDFLNYIFVILAASLVFFLVMPTLNVFFSLFSKERIKSPKQPIEFDYGIVITAYKNADIAKGLIKSLLKQLHANHHIYLVADGCDLNNWDIEDEKLTVLMPSHPLNLKAKSIIHGIENFVRPHDYITVFDADNLAHPDFLTEINRYANAGYQAIQGQRTAKNLDTLMACADALGEFYKNYIDRVAPYRNGSSAVISGSGMAVESELYKAYLASPEIEQGKHQWKKMLQEDKILQNFLLRKDTKIAYAWDAICYDEKVTSADAVETQRSRWLFSYFQNIPNSLGILRRGLFNFSWNQWLFGLVTIAPPMFVMLFAAFGLAVLGLFINLWVSLALVVAVVLFILTIFWTLKLSQAPQPVWNAVAAMPAFVFRQIKGLFKMGNPNKNFKHTEHKVSVTIEDVLK
ncbi:MAG: glycosyltransferase family 2 protein [Saprospiraceae bacterium]|nr:glycosyltransferase family 2 protein [Saprospiraceae bacterium]MCF8251951.1 glycosyltransferase family 2 protein [Saprospiraceae bacterium]MCF8282913.1 glycosyltransferase family 2 protein [Bacteroidales bacterium]MCF8313645.1 glycosyltransferase family 2 protein [Saprospiraceae bacterium]MCF8442352.1 glycosyltransferase family 2 protein [Saprospiraceae bacterium]